MSDNEEVIAKMVAGVSQNLSSTLAAFSFNQVLMVQGLMVELMKKIQDDAAASASLEEFVEKISRAYRVSREALTK